MGKARTAPRAVACVTMKEIAVRLNCHERTAEKWIKKLQVPADLVGHGPNKWTQANADLIVERYFAFYRSKGTSPEIIRAKFAGLYQDKNQLSFKLSSN
jgi:transposase